MESNGTFLADRLGLWLAGPVLGLAVLAGGGALAQSTGGQTQTPTKTNPDATGPQTAVPAPLPEGQADVPGGSAKNGVIKPPPTGGVVVVAPPAAGTMPVIPPPGTGANQPNVQPK